MSVWTVTVKAPRMAGLGRVIQELAIENGHECIVTQLNRSWFTELLRIEVKGQDLTGFRWGSKSTMAEYRTIHILAEELT